MEERKEREEGLRGMGEGGGAGRKAEQSFIAVGDKSMLDAAGEAGEAGGTRGVQSEEEFKGRSGEDTEY